MVKICFICLLFFYNNLLWDTALPKYDLMGNAQGTTFHLTYFANDSLVSINEIDSIFNEIDNSVSLYKTGSLINEFNKASKGVKLDQYLSILIPKSLHVYRQTAGAFDITVKPLVQVWGFGPKRSASQPSDKEIKDILKCVGSFKLSVRCDSLIKSTPCLQIDLNGIAQGYSVDLICQYLDKKGVENYLVEVGGELKVRGVNKATSLPFKIGIESPADSLNLSIRRKVILKEGSLTTSGNYRNYKFSGVKKISHLISPFTGYPITNEMLSVTVWANDAVTADGFDNAFMGMGLSKSLKFLKGRNDIGAYLIYLKPDGSVADTIAGKFPEIIDN
jgi:thiamine biosynthesis lipoprotein